MNTTFATITEERPTPLWGAETPPKRPDAPVRLAILGTPRSGGTWLQFLLKAAYMIPGQPVPNPAALDWQSLPAECVLHMHWPRTLSLARRLDVEGFRVVTLARHPLDVLISILQFCRHDNTPLHWLAGRKGNERLIRGVLPNSDAFLEYATGPRAAALWRSIGSGGVADALQVRYEELVADAPGELRRIASTLAEPAYAAAPAAVCCSTALRFQLLAAKTGVPVTTSGRASPAYGSGC